jgi:plastocyanin
MRARVAIAAGVMLVVAAFALPAGASAKTKTVYAGPPPSTQALAHKLGITKAFGKKYSPSANAFFNQTVTINQGDAVKWVGLVSGFHTIDLPGSSGKDIPLIIPVGGLASVNDFAGNPFWFSGHAPNLGFNPQLLAPSGGSTYDGTSRVDTGLAAGPKPSDSVKVTFTKPGRYKYFCDVHTGMVGYVVVRAKGKAVPSAKQDAAALKRQLTTDLLAAKKLASTKIAANHVSLGLSSPAGVELFAMFPARLTVKAGTVVTFSMSLNSREVHTAAFGTKSYLKVLADSVASPSFDQQALYPSSSPALGPIALSPSSHGNGFANTGALDRDATTPLTPSGQIKFTTPGTYHYVCLIHPFMHGTVVVK